MIFLCGNWLRKQFKSSNAAEYFILQDFYKESRKPWMRDKNLQKNNCDEV